MRPNGRVGLAREFAADFAQHRDERAQVYPIRIRITACVTGSANMSSSFGSG